MENEVLRWDMYGAGTAVAFRAMRLDDRYELSVSRGEDLLAMSHTEDGETMLRRSSALRECLREIGFAPKPDGQRTSHLSGGVCWGPAAPIQSSVVHALLGL